MAARIDNGDSKMLLQQICLLPNLHEQSNQKTQEKTYARLVNLS